MTAMPIEGRASTPEETKEIMILASDIYEIFKAHNASPGMMLTTLATTTGLVAAACGMTAEDTERLLVHFAQGARKAHEDFLKSREEQKS